ncbi:heme-binding protein [Oceanisphaera sp. IT1-181]|uniref:GlcG/HbpS family heme-binding protein n=1 Tax=Oceanisphaera sp. IT1-181 TaxID=3081199 RepID=UPI0029CA4C94|nr:heme-binding protein [Oceanisphaera sp. IT1-181]
MTLSARSVVRACQIMVEQIIEEGSQPVCLAAVDNSGALVYFYRMDGAPERLINIAIGKAYTAAKMGVSTAMFRQRLLSEQLSLDDFLDEKFTSLPGGLPLFNKQILMGAVGVSGQVVEDDMSLCQQFAERIQISL